MSHIIGMRRYARETYPGKSLPAGVTPSSVLTPPLDVPAGTVYDMVRGGPNNLWFLSGAQSTAELPDGAQNGDVALLKLVGDFSGAGGSHPLLILPRGGATVEVPGDPGTYTAADTQTSYAGTGGNLYYQFDSAGPRWGLIGSS